MIFTDTPKLAFSFPIGLYSQLFEPREIPIGQLVHKCAGNKISNIILIHTSPNQYLLVLIHENSSAQLYRGFTPLPLP